MSKWQSHSNFGGLRPPVPFLDLLLTLVLTFILFIAPARDASPNVNVPVSGNDSQTPPSAMLTVVPHWEQGRWIFETEDHARLTAAAVATVARSNHKRVVIVAPARTTLEDFVSMTAPLRERSVDFGLAVKDGAKP